MEEKKLTDEELNELIKKLEYQSWAQNFPELSQAAYMLKYQKAEIERLTEYNANLNGMCLEFIDKNAELQKQVNELKVFKDEAISLSLYGVGLKDGKALAVKDTAKEILQYVGDLYDDDDQRFQLKDYQWHKNLCKKFGVEVE